MISKKITDADIAKLKVSSLPSRPTAPKSFGGAGYTASDMKAAFDRLPLYIISRFNELIEDVSAEGDEGIAAAIPSGIREGHTLAELMQDIVTGALSSYLTVLGEPLSSSILSLKESISIISETADTSASNANFSVAKIEQFETALEELNLALDEALGSIAELNQLFSAESAQRAAEYKELRDEIGSAMLSCKNTEGRLENITASINQHTEQIDQLCRELSEPGEITIDCGGPADI